jgi:hypothetical protein
MGSGFAKTAWTTAGEAVGVDTVATAASSFVQYNRQQNRIEKQSTN